MVDVRDTKTMRRSFRTRRMLPGGFPELHPGLVCDAPSGHGVRNRVRAWDWDRVDVEAERNRNRQKNVRRDVRRRDRGQRPTATKDPKTKRLRRYVNFPTRANGTMTFPVSGHQPCVRYNLLTVCPIPDPHHVSGTIASPCVRYRTTTLFPITPIQTRLIQNQSTWKKAV